MFPPPYAPISHWYSIVRYNNFLLLLFFFLFTRYFLSSWIAIGRIYVQTTWAARSQYSNFIFRILHSTLYRLNFIIGIFRRIEFLTWIITSKIEEITIVVRLELCTWGNSWDDRDRLISTPVAEGDDRKAMSGREIFQHHRNFSFLFITSLSFPRISRARGKYSYAIIYKARAVVQTRWNKILYSFGFVFFVRERVYCEKCCLVRACFHE